jgi:hypothetical protein
MEESSIIMNSSEPKLLLKLYNSIPIDRDKISDVGEQPSSYQWELVRQNIKYIILFLDKLQIYIGELVRENKEVFMRNNYKFFVEIWNDFSDEQECQRNYLPYLKLFKIFSYLAKNFVDTSGGQYDSFSSFYVNYFNYFRMTFSGHYDNIIDAWNNELEKGCGYKLSLLGNGELIVHDPSCSSLPNELFADIYDRFDYYVCENRVRGVKKSTLYTQTTRKENKLDEFLNNRSVKIASLASTVLLPFTLVGTALFLRRKK